MATFIIGATLAGSLAGAFALQKAVLEAFFRLMDPQARR